MKRTRPDLGNGEPPFKQPRTSSDLDWEREYRKRLAAAKDARTVQRIWEEASTYISLNEIHLTTALKGCHNDSKIAMQIMREARQSGLQPNIFHFTCLLRIPGTPTKKILAQMEKHSIEGNHWSWNAALTGCAPQEVWEIFSQVQQPDRYAIASLLKKCRSTQEVSQALKAAKKHGVQYDRAILNATASAAPAIFMDCIHQIQLQNPKIKPDLQFFNIVLNKATWIACANKCCGSSSACHSQCCIVFASNFFKLQTFLKIWLFLLLQLRFLIRLLKWKRTNLQLQISPGRLLQN